MEEHTCGSWPDPYWTPVHHKMKKEAMLKCLACNSDITMKQFKAEWQTDKDGSQHTYYTTHHLITQHNAFVEAWWKSLADIDEKIEERFSKPDWRQIKVEAKAYPAGTAEINPKTNKVSGTGGTDPNASKTHGSGSISYNRTVTLPKPEWWEYRSPGGPGAEIAYTVWRSKIESYLAALEAAGKAMGVEIKLKD